MKLCLLHLIHFCYQDEDANLKEITYETSEFGSASTVASTVAGALSFGDAFEIDSGDVKMNELTNSELLEVLVPAIEEKIKAQIVESRDDAVGEADIRFKKLETNQNILHGAITEQLAAAQTVRLSEKYIDFDQFKDDTMNVRKEHPNLPIEECYLLAKAKAGSTIPSANEVGTERPGSSARRTVPIGRDPGRRTDYGSNVNRTSSDQVFSNMLNDGVKKVVARRRGIS